MSETPRTSQWLIAVVALLVGLLGFLVMPSQCQQKHEDKTPWLSTPSPDPIESRKRQNPVITALSSDGAGVKGKVSTAGGNPADLKQAAIELSHKPVEEYSEALERIMSDWALSDPKSAAEWVGGLPAGEFRESAATSLCEAWAGVDVKAAVTWVASNLGKGSLRGALGAVAAVWTRNEPVEAAAWVAKLSDAEDRSAGEAGIALIWGGTNPAAASDWLESLPDERQAGALPNLLVGWAATDPAAAAAWLQTALASNPKLPVSSAAVLVSAWVGKDAGEVSHWLNALPEEELYEVASTAFAQAVVEKSPKDALAWARSLSNPENRILSVTYAMEAWMDKDREGFVAELPKELEATSDPILRKAIYDMLYRKDPSFKESLLDLVEIPAGSDASPPNR